LRAWDELDHHSIVLRPDEMRGMDYAGFKVASDSDLDASARRIEEHVTEVEEVAAGEQPRLGRRLSLRCADRPSDWVVGSTAPARSAIL
jgi:catechol 2,3-dioxygenase